MLSCTLIALRKAEVIRDKLYVLLGHCQFPISIPIRASALPKSKRQEDFSPRRKAAENRRGNLRFRIPKTVLPKNQEMVRNIIT